MKEIYSKDSVTGSLPSGIYIFERYDPVRNDGFHIWTAIRLFDPCFLNINFLTIHFEKRFLGFAEEPPLPIARILSLPIGKEVSFVGTTKFEMQSGSPSY